MQLTGVFWFAIGQGGRVADVLRDSTKHTEDLTFAIIALTATQEKRTQVLNYIMYSDSIQNKNIDSLFFEVQMLKYKVHE